MYVHHVITEKATVSFTNGANRQSGEGIRDNGHLFITSILPNALNINPSSEKTSKSLRNDAIERAKESRTVREVAESIVGYKQMTEANQKRILLSDTITITEML